MRKKRVLIWGGGKLSNFVYDCIDTEIVEIVGLVDRDISNIQFSNNKVNVYPLESLGGLSFDYILITVKKYEDILSQAEAMGINTGVIYAYWNMKIDIPFICNREQRFEELIYRNAYLEMLVDSMEYELAKENFPTIKSGQELLKKMVSDRTSLSRFGDGEFEIMRGKNRPWFQKCDGELSARLKEIIKTNDNRINIAIANNFYDLAKFKPEDANTCRLYMANGTRQAILSLIDINKVYYDTYVTRPYIIYKNKDNADTIFELFKKLWRNRDILVVEGEYSRFGVNNDLLDGAKSVKRIICPAKNAWDYYERIFREVKKHITKDILILISLGPTASVLAFDLARENIQAVDIGQLDNEYEWYLSGTKERYAIPGKLTAEVFDCNGKVIEDNLEVKSENYFAQICATII